MAFFKREDDNLLTAPNFVSWPGFELLAEKHTEYQYPVEGWTWYANLDEAMVAFSNSATGT